jgi:hypothetical protein
MSLTFYTSVSVYRLSRSACGKAFVAGTDNFAARGIQYPTAVLDQFKLPTADRERILKGNAMKVLHL